MIIYCKLSVIMRWLFYSCACETGLMLETRGLKCVVAKGFENGMCCLHFTIRIAFMVMINC